MAEMTLQPPDDKTHAPLSTSLRVLYMTPYLERGGTERHLIDLVQTIQWRERPWVIGPKGPACALLEEAGARWVPAPVLSLGSGTISAWRSAFRAAVDAFEPHVVHGHAGLELLWITRHLAPRIPRVFTVHGYTGAWLSYRLTSWLGTGLARRVIAVSSSEAARLGPFPPERLRVIRNGAADPLSLPPGPPPKGFPRDSAVVAVTSRLEPAKGVDLVVEAFLELLRYSTTARLGDGRSGTSTLVVMGSGSQESTLRARVEQEGAGQHIHFLGYRADAASLLRHADLLVQTSRHDALPLAVVEAMAAGVPAIVSDAGGLPELVQDGVTGRVVPAGRVAPIAQALQELLVSPDRRRRMGLAARSLYESRFTLEHFAAATLDVYHEVLDEFAAGAFQDPP